MNMVTRKGFMFFVILASGWLSFRLIAQDHAHDHQKEHLNETKVLPKMKKNHPPIENIVHGSKEHNDHDSLDEHDEHSGHKDEKGIEKKELGHLLEKDHDDHGEKDKNDKHEEEGHDSHDEKSVELNSEQIKDFDIQTEIVRSGSLEKYIELPGEIVINGDKVVHLVPRFTGIVKIINKYIGDKVKKDDVLATIESNQSLQNYSVKSKIFGTVIEKHISLGEVVKEDSEIYVVADLRTVWVNLNAYQQDVPFLKKGQKVIIFSSQGVSPAISTIQYVSPTLSEKTRTALIRIQIQNKDNNWRPGTFVTGKVVLSNQDVPLLVARSAIQIVNDLPNIFIKKDNKYTAVPVKLGRKDDNNIEIISGLNIGQVYVKKGAFTLKADIGKGQFGDGHNH